MKALVFIALLLPSISFSQLAPEWSVNFPTNTPPFGAKGYPFIKFDKSGNLALGDAIDFGGGDGFNYHYYSVSESGLMQWTSTGNRGGDEFLCAMEIDDQDHNYYLMEIRTYSNKSRLLLQKSDDLNLEWEIQFGGTDSVTIGNGISLDSNDNVFVTGHSFDSMGIGQLFVQRINSATGNVLWTTCFGSDTTASYFGKKIMALNNSIFVLGESWAPGLVLKYWVLELDFSGAVINSFEGPIPRPGRAFYLDHHANSYIGFGGDQRFKLMKINSSGIVQWTDSVPTNLPPNVGVDRVGDILVDSLDNVYATGLHVGANGTNSDFLTRKYSANGSLLWSTRFDYLGDSTSEAAWALTIDSELNVFVAGSGQKAEGSDSDYLIVQMDAQGILEGYAFYGGNDQLHDYATDIVATSDSAIYVTGVGFSDGVSNTTTLKFSDLIPVGTDPDRSSTKEVQVGPNPFTDELRFKFVNESQATVELKVFDVMGRPVHEEATQEQQILIGHPTFPAGHYYYQLRFGEAVMTGHLVKQ